MLSDYLLHQLEKRLSGLQRLLRPGFPALYVLVNAAGSLIDRVEQRHLIEADRLPANLLLKARRPLT